MGWPMIPAIAMSCSQVMTLTLFLGACAVVETIKPDGTVQRTISMISPIHVISTQSSTDRAVKVFGVGLLLDDSESTLGYFNSSVFRINPNCRVMLIDNTDDQLNRFAAQVHDLGTICNGTDQKGKNNAATQ
jgi:hypothetical protein